MANFEKFKALYSVNFSKAYFTRNLNEEEIKIWMGVVSNFNCDLEKLFENVSREWGSSIRNPGLPIFRKHASALEKQKRDQIFREARCALCDGNGWLYYVGHLVRSGDRSWVEPGYATLNHQTRDGRAYDAVIPCRCSAGQHHQKEKQADSRIQDKVIEMTVEFNRNAKRGYSSKMLWEDLLHRMCVEQQTKNITQEVA